MTWQGKLALAGACAALGLLVAAAGRMLPVQLAALGLGIALVGASFLLAWAADAGETVFSGGAVLAVIALMTVLPELVIEVRFAYDQQSELVTANLTGATRLLLTGAIGLPLAVAFNARRRRQPPVAIELAPPRRLELTVLLIASAFAVKIVVRGNVTLLDGIFLVALYAFYARRARATPEEPAVVGVPAGLVSLPSRHRRPVLVALILAAGVVVITVAKPFAVALLATGTSIGSDPYYLVQSVVPVATEAPEFVVVAVLVANRRPAQGLALFLAASVSQWTLAVGVLPISYLAGGGGMAMPLVSHQQLEVALTSAQTLFAVAALVSLRPHHADAALMVTLLLVQLVYPTAFVELASAFVLLVFAVDLLIDRRRAVRSLLGTLRRA